MYPHREHREGQIQLLESVGPLSCLLQPFAQQTIPPQQPPADFAVDGKEEVAKPDDASALFKLPVGKVVDPPKAEQYTVLLSEGITGEELGIIKLTTQIVARNGKSFLTGLKPRGEGAAGDEGLGRERERERRVRECRAGTKRRGEEERGREFDFTGRQLKVTTKIDSHSIERTRK